MKTAGCTLLNLGTCTKNVGVHVLKIQNVHQKRLGARFLFSYPRLGGTDFEPNNKTLNLHLQPYTLHPTTLTLNPNPCM